VSGVACARRLHIEAVTPAFAICDRNRTPSIHLEKQCSAMANKERILALRFKNFAAEWPSSKNKKGRFWLGGAPEPATRQSALDCHVDRVAFAVN
jgi:hypothetical protein